LAIGFVSVIDFSLIVSSASVASLVTLVGLLTHRPFRERLLTAVIEATKISWRLKQAATLGGATLQSSATKLVDIAFYYFASSLLHICFLVREKMLWWLALARKRCGGGLPLLVNPTTVICYNLQNNFFLSGIR
jgi:hypothetical protein